MSKPYQERLKAIRKMLASPLPEVTQEGYSLLFKLWLENMDSLDFHQDLIPVAAEHENTVQELQARLNELVLRDEITDIYLQRRLETLDSEVVKFKLRSPKFDEQDTDSLVPIKSESENLVTKLAAWQIALLAIILIAIGLITFLPHTYQKFIIFAIALSSAIILPYRFSQKSRASVTKLSGIKLNYSFPTYLSIGDENIIDISIENSNKVEFNGAITLVFNDKDSLITPAPNENLSVKVEVPSLGRESKQFKFLLAKKPPDGNVNYYFQIISSSGPHCKSDEEFFLIAPIPYLRSAWTWLFSTAGLGALCIALLWEQLEKLLGLD